MSLLDGLLSRRGGVHIDSRKQFKIGDGGELVVMAVEGKRERESETKYTRENDVDFCCDCMIPPMRIQLAFCPRVFGSIILRWISDCAIE